MTNVLMDTDETFFGKFGACCHIVYMEWDGREHLRFQPYDMDGEMLPKAEQWLKHENLPVLLFQLVDAGYIVSKSVVRGITVIKGISTQYMERQIAKQGGQGK